MKIKILSLEKETRNIQVDNENKTINSLHLPMPWPKPTGLSFFLNSNQNKLAEEYLSK